MFYYISGTLAHSDMNTAVVDAGGVGYKMTISQMTYSSLPRQISETPHTVKLYTHLSVREDGIELYGFGSAEELESFQLLITVSGVGPKAAISILSQLTPSRLVAAICADDKKAIAAANGIGPKTAARIILELKDKLQKVSLSTEELGVANEPSFVASSSTKRSDATEALMALGYSRTEATAVLKNIDVDALELDEIIRLALKKIMK